MVQAAAIGAQNTAAPALQSARVEAPALTRARPAPKAQSEYAKGMQLERPSNQTLAKMAFYKPAARPQNPAQPSAVQGSKQGGPAQGTEQAAQSKGAEPYTGCQTCQTRQYKDGSDDSGVSFQSAAHIPASTAGIAVAAHEGEHVSRDTAKAQDEGRVVVKKTVTTQMACCPECNKLYVAGGTTSMTTADAGSNAEVSTGQDWMGGTGENVDMYV